MPAFRIAADNHLFYLLDDEACPLYPDRIDRIEVIRRVKVVPNLIAVYALDDVEVEVDLELCDKAPQVDEAALMHVVEASLDIPSGRVVLATLSSYLAECPRVSVVPGCYRVRIAVARPSEGQREHYFISLWPSPTAPVAVLKAAVGPGRGLGLRNFVCVALVATMLTAVFPWTMRLGAGAVELQCGNSSQTTIFANNEECGIASHERVKIESPCRCSAVNANLPFYVLGLQIVLAALAGFLVFHERRSRLLLVNCSVALGALGQAAIALLMNWFGAWAIAVFPLLLLSIAIYCAIATVSLSIANRVAGLFGHHGQSHA